MTTTTTKPTVKDPAKKPAGGRKSSGASNTKAVKPQVKTTKVLGNVGERDSFWYLKHEADLELVTAEPKNDNLGIKRIGVYKPSDAQAANMVIASIQLETIAADIRGIQIKESENTPGALYLQTGSKNIAKEGEKAKWFNEVTLPKPVTAQILSYVDSLLIDA